MVSTRVGSTPSVTKMATIFPSSAMPAPASVGASTKMARRSKAVRPVESWTAMVGAYFTVAGQGKGRGAHVHADAACDLVRSSSTKRSGSAVRGVVVRGR